MIALFILCILSCQVVLPFVEKYFRAHREYFVGTPNAPNTSSMASVKEKEMCARFVVISLTLFA